MTELHRPPCRAWRAPRRWRHGYRPVRARPHHRRQPRALERRAPGFRRAPSIAGFVAAGSDIILTNSFGGNRQRLKLHSAQDRVGRAQSCRRPRCPRGCRRGRQAGPGRGLDRPHGRAPGAARAADGRRGGRGLRRAGSSPCRGGRRSPLDRDHVGTPRRSRPPFAAPRGPACLWSARCRFDTNGRTMMGLTPAAAVASSTAWPQPPGGLWRQLRRRPGPAPGHRPGLPRGGGSRRHHRRQGQLRHPASTATAISTIAARRRSWPPTRALPAMPVPAMIGGCCGTAPVHLQAMRAGPGLAPRAGRRRWTRSPRRWGRSLCPRHPPRRLPAAAARRA